MVEEAWSVEHDDGSPITRSGEPVSGLVSREEHGRGERGENVGEPAARRAIERGDRFVEQQQARLAGQHARQGDELTLAGPITLATSFNADLEL